MANSEAESTPFKRAREILYSALIGDILDDLGYPKQFLPPDIRPIDPDMRIAGRAFTVTGRDLVKESIPEDPYGLLFEALDNLGADEVFLYTGGSPSYAVWGGLMSTRATHLKAAGAIIDGCYRDTREILDIGFPTFGKGAWAPDQKSRGLITGYGTPIQIGAVSISPGDYVFADRDGVVIIPAAIGPDVLDAAFEKHATENNLRKALLEGMGATEAFERFGIF